METFDLGNTVLIHEALETGPEAQFTEEFHTTLGIYLDEMTLGYNPRADTATEHHEGPFGKIPPPARREMVRGVLAGTPLPPLKVLEETTEGPPQIKIEHLAYHLIVEVNPISISNPAEVKETVSIITILAERLKKIQEGNELWTRTNNDIPPIRILAGTGNIHLLQRNVTGNYKVQSLPLNSESDALKAIERYKQSLSDVYKISPEDKPKVDAVAHLVEFKKIGLAVQEDTGEGKLSLPIIIYPKSYNGWPTSESYHLLAANQIPFMVRQEGQKVSQWQLLREMPKSTVQRREFATIGDNTVKEFDDEPDLAI